MSPDIQNILGERGIRLDAAAERGPRGGPGDDRNVDECLDVGLVFPRDIAGRVEEVPAFGQWRAKCQADRLARLGNRAGHRGAAAYAEYNPSGDGRQKCRIEPPHLTSPSLMAPLG